MSNKLMEFFTAAQHKVAETATAQEAAEQARQIAAGAEKQRQTARAANLAALDERLRDEYGDLFDVLRKLPEKDRKVFTVSEKESRDDGSSTAVGRDISVYYKVKERPQTEQDYQRRREAFERVYDYVRPEQGFSLHVERQPDAKLELEVTKYREIGSNKYGRNNHYVSEKAPDFTAAATLMGRELGAIAPERLDDIGKALGLLKAETKPEAQASSSLASPGLVFKI